MHVFRWLDHTRRHPSAILLVVQLAGMLLYPFIEKTDAGRYRSLIDRLGLRR